ncbi:MAG: hypothetical protein Q8Q49_01610 [bacterium]|nr:hypothetical protein [bacterium]
MLNRNIKLISVFVMFVSAVMIAGGCGVLDIQPGADGQPTTVLTDAIGTVADLGESVGLFFPIAAAVGGLLSIIANGILGVVVKKQSATGGKMDSALTAAVAGVNDFVEDYDEAKHAILTILTELPIDDKKRTDITAALERIGSVKNTISAYATADEIYAFLRMFIKTREARGKA